MANDKNFKVKNALEIGGSVKSSLGTVTSSNIDLSTGNYFNLWMNGLQSERNYRFCVKVVSGSGTTDEQINFYDNDNEFRIVR